MPEPKEEDVVFTRRNIIGGLGAVGAVVHAEPLHAFETNEQTEQTEPEVQESLIPAEGKESIEAPHEASEVFEKQRETYVRAYGTLTTRQIQFIADDGGPLGAPFPVAPINGIDPGRINDAGVIQSGIRAEWLNEARRHICQQHPGQKCDVANSLPAQTNTIGVVRNAKEFTPGLTAETLFDVAKHFGSEPVPGIAEKQTRIAYLLQKITENTSLPKDILAELADIVPGLAAQESQYDSRSVSSAKAFGTFQFMPETWRSMGYTEADKSSFPLQVSAVSRFFETAHSFFDSAIAPELTAVRERFFDNDRAAFNKYFFVPLLVNSYNAGPGRVATVLTWFARTFPDKESLEKRIGYYPHGFGYDVYAAMASIARETKAVLGYGRHSSEYVVRSMAFAKLIKERISKQEEETHVEE